MSYQNTAFAAGKSTFAQVNPQGANSVVTFGSSVANVPVPGGRVQMVANQVTLVVPVNVAASGETPHYLNESVKISTNSVKGGSSIASVLAEALRLHGLAVTEYNLNNGLVPTGAAILDQASGG